MNLIPTSSTKYQEKSNRIKNVPFQSPWYRRFSKM